MKLNNIKSLIGASLLLGSLSACTDWTTDAPDFTVPKATLTPNATILDVKTKWWDDETNYIQKIPLNDDGSHVVVAGRVISNDRAGNVYKSLYIQDETAALPMSINQSSLYNSYRVGQEIVVDLTEMYIGKYNGLQQLGFPEWYATGNAWEATFMPYAFFQDHIQLNGLPDPTCAYIQPEDVADFNELGSNAEQLRYWQGRLVRLNNVEFVDGGKLAFTDGYKITTNRDLKDSQGNTLSVRTSGYSNFRNAILPEGKIDIVGILGYYSGAYQLTINDLEQALQDVTIPKGTQGNPYTVAEAAEIESAPDYQGDTYGWVEGYIVGCVAPGVQTITQESDILWDGSDLFGVTLVIAPTPETKDINQVMVFNLPENSELRRLGNLADNPDNLHKQMKVYGKLQRVLDITGMTNITGDSNSYWIEGQVEPQPEKGDGSAEHPYTVQQVLNGEATGTEVWITGYIVGNIDGEGKVLASESQFVGPFTIATNLLLAPQPNVTDYTKCTPVQLPSGAVRTALNLKDNPGNLGRQVTIKGNCEKYFGANGVKSVTEYVWGSGGSDEPVTPPAAGEGDGTAANPFTAADILAGVSGTNVWFTGYIVGNIDGEGKTLATESQFVGPFTIATNLLVAATPTETDYTKCVPVQLPSGAVRTALNLVDNPGNLGKQVSLYGNCEKYFGTTGFKSVTKYAWGAKGEEGGDEPVTPTGTLTFEKATSIVSGQQYIFVHNGQVCVPIAANKTYGYLATEAPVSSADGKITTAAANAIVISANGSGYTLLDCYNRYISMDDTHTSLQLYTTVNPGSVWSITVNSASQATITNTNRAGYVIRWSDQFSNFSTNNTGTGDLPELYVLDGQGGGGGTTPEEPGEPETPGEIVGDGTETNPFTVGDVIIINPQSTSTVTDDKYKGAWVEGYIIGYYNNGCVYSVDGAPATNILLGETADVNTEAKTVAVQLPSGAARTALNLKDNPGLYKTKVLVKGDILLYQGLPGVRSVKEYKIP